jgi:hypothetical protein
MILSYERGESALSLARRYGTSHQVITPLLAKHGVQVRPSTKVKKARKCSFDEHFFHVIDTEDKAYWLGFITADGCVKESRPPVHVTPRLQVHLALSDCTHLEKLRTALQANCMISKNAHSCALELTSQQLVDDLAQYGVLPRKTGSTQPGQVHPELARHYWRGIIDGDGYLSKDGDQLVLVGDYEVVLGFQAFVLAHCLNIKASIFRKGNIYTFKVTGTHAMKMLEVLYGDASVYLDRKYERACAART